MTKAELMNALAGYEDEAEVYIQTNHRKRIRELETENARLNMEMVAYREKLSPQDAAAMVAVINALYAEKSACGPICLSESDAGAESDAKS